MSIFYENRKNEHTCFIEQHLDFPPHLHKHIEMICVLEGEIIFSVSGQNFILKRNDCAVVSPNRIHSYDYIKDSQIFLLITDIHNISDLYGVISEQQLKKPVFNLNVLSEYGQDALRMLIHRARSRVDFSAVDKGFMEVLFFDIYDNIDTIPQNIYNLSLIEKVLIYIDNNYINNLTEEIVAKEIGISKYYLSHIFSNELNMTFPFYLKNKRLHKAINMLNSSDMSITGIALESGFANIRSFNRAFKEQFKITPREFKKKK